MAKSLSRWTLPRGICLRLLALLSAAWLLDGLMFATGGSPRGLAGIGHGTHADDGFQTGPATLFTSRASQQVVDSIGPQSTHSMRKLSMLYVHRQQIALTPQKDLFATGRTNIPSPVAWGIQFGIMGLGGLLLRSASRRRGGSTCIGTNYSTCPLRFLAAAGVPSGPAPLPLVAVVGAGPAGFFAAIRAAEVGAGHVEVHLYEAGRQQLRKVQLSGGGRCNVMHDPFDPAKTVRRITLGDPSVAPSAPFNPAYPRGGTALCELMSSTFSPRDMHRWFTDRGVPLKTEADGRVFPRSDRSDDVIGALEGAARQAGVRVWLRRRVVGVRPWGPAGVELTTDEGAVQCAAAVLAPGSDRNTLTAIAQGLGHAIVPPVPSLFAFRLGPLPPPSPPSLFADADIAALAGLTLPYVTVRLEPLPGAPGDAARAAVAALKKDRNAVRHGGLTHQGPVVFTHEGLSGPAALRLSAFAARALHTAGPGAFALVLNAVAGADLPGPAQAEAALGALRTTSPAQRAACACPLLLPDGSRAVPQRLWRRACAAAGIQDTQTWAEVSKPALRLLAEALTASRAVVLGKAVNADEFVTSGGVALSEVDVRRGMASKRAPGVFFAGEVLDCDGVTGGFSFQVCWATGYAAGGAAARHALTPPMDGPPPL